MAKRNYSNYSKSKSKPEEDFEPILEPVEDPVRSSPIIGIVSDCVRLNVREEPSMSADVLMTIDAGSEVQIIETINGDASETSFYKIITVCGMEGYCMQKYINV